MTYYMKAWLAAATLPVWLASACWFDAVKIANAPLRALDENGESAKRES